MDADKNKQHSTKTGTRREETATDADEEQIRRELRAAYKRLDRQDAVRIGIREVAEKVHEKYAARGQDLDMDALVKMSEQVGGEVFHVTWEW
jgi:hypothetical protein